MAGRISALPAKRYSVSFMAAYSLRVLPQTAFGTQQLSDNALIALKDRKASLLANHGMIATGVDLADAFRVAVEVETLSEMYLRALQAGEPALLSELEFRDAQNRFAGYGQASEANRRPD